jgi:broad specificity phosphatase PhoE
MSRVVLVRHGETVWHEENRYAGRSDIALTDRGRVQAGSLAAWAAHAGLSAVWCSPLQRSIQTAEPAASAAGVSLHVDPRLIELDFGRGEGLTDAEMRSQFPGERAAFLEAPATHWLPGGEDPRHATARAVEAIREIAAANRRALVVTHNTLLRLVLCQVLGIPLDSYRSVFPLLDNVSLTELEILRGGAIALLMFNAPLAGGQ